MKQVAAATLALVASVTSGCHEVFDLVAVEVPEAEVCLEEDFDDGEIDAASWIKLGASVNVVVDVVDGHGSIEVPESTAAAQDPYGGIRSQKRDFTGVAAQVEVLTVPLATTPSEVVMQLTRDNTNLYSFLVQRGMLLARKRVDGVDTIDSVDYDNVQHRFIRMRLDATENVLLYEARPSGGQWAEVTRTSATVPLTEMTVEVRAGSYDVAPAFTATFDNVQLVGRCTF